jgi:hypothetical protein
MVEKGLPTDQLSYSEMPNWPLFENTSWSFITEKFEDYLLQNVLDKKSSMTIPQHSAWILARKCGLHVNVKPESRLNQDVKLYFEQFDYSRNETQNKLFYENLMKQDQTELKAVIITKHPQGRSGTDRKTLTFTKR